MNMAICRKFRQTSFPSLKQSMRPQHSRIVYRDDSEIAGSAGPDH